VKFESDFIPENKKIINRTCPKCENKLIVRKNSLTGKFFISCTQYPDCKFADGIDIESKDQMKLF
jgi:ssDNA-binding Zn-finger/Zn-ribbon topoisomerase 1